MKNFSFFALSLFITASTAQAAITADVSATNKLTVITTNGEDCILSVDAGLLKINGLDPDTGPLVGNDLANFEFEGDDLPNTVDVSALNELDISIYANTAIKTKGGDDTIVGSDYYDYITPGTGIDNVTGFGGGGNFYFWEKGDGSETVTKVSTEGTLTFKFEDTPGDDQVEVTTQGESILISGPTFTETITLNKLTGISLDLGGGTDTGSTSDLSAFTELNNITIEKVTGAMNYDSTASNKRHLIVAQAANITAQATPGTNSYFSFSSGFTQNSVTFRMMLDPQSSENILLTMDDPATTSTLTGFSSFNISSSNGDDHYYIDNLENSEFAQLTMRPNNGADTIECVYMENSRIRHDDDSFDQNNSMILDARGFPLVLESDPTQYRAPGYPGFYFIKNVQNVTLLNEGVFTDELWLVD